VSLPKQPFELSILDNANDFVEEALTSAFEAEQHPKRWKFAIFCIVQAIELVLKEGLKREHEWLIYESVDKRKNTVGWRTAVSRLSSLGLVEFSSEELKEVEFAFEKRNSIAHHHVEIDPKRLKPAFAKLLGLLSDLYRKVLDDDVRTAVPDSIFRRIVRLEDYGLELAKRVPAESEARLSLEECPDCGWLAFDVNEDYEAICHVCPTKEDVLFCNDCDSLVIRGLEYEYSNEHLCISCFERRAGHDQHMEDLMMDSR
jgi:hypothetical protein